MRWHEGRIRVSRRAGRQGNDKRCPACLRGDFVLQRDHRGRICRSLDLDDDAGLGRVREDAAIDLRSERSLPAGSLFGRTERGQLARTRPPDTGIHELQAAALHFADQAPVPGVARHEPFRHQQHIRMRGAAGAQRQAVIGIGREAVRGETGHEVFQESGLRGRVPVAFDNHDLAACGGARDHLDRFDPLLRAPVDRF